MKVAVATRLSSDSTLSDLLPGGIYHEEVEISRQDTPAAFDGNGEVMACALVKLGSTIPAGPYKTSALQPVDVYLYHPTSFLSLQVIVNRVFTLLNSTKLTPGAGGRCWEINHENDTPDDKDPALGVPMKRSRFIAVINRVYT